MILIELTAAIDAAGTLQTFYVGSDSFVTGTGDTPASIAFDPRLIDPGALGVNVFSDGRTGGITKLETGEIVLANADGALDVWLNYSFDGRPVTIRSGNGGAYPGSFTTVLAGTIESTEASWDKFVLRLKDKQQLFTLPALTTRYAGNNALPNGLEGTASDLGGKVKPKVYGKVFNVPAPLVNTAKLTYEVGVCSAINAVYDRGLAITAAADFATSALLQGASPAASTYITCLAEGYFRLGSTPAGLITADVTQGAAAANRTVAQIVKAIALSAGLSASEISAADVTALDAAAPQVVGIWLSDELTYAQALDEVAASVGAYYGFDAAGVLRMGQITTPSGTPVMTLYDYDTLEGFERRPPRDNGIPVWRMVLGHTRIWATQPSDLAGAVTTAARAYLAEPVRKAAAEDTAIKTQWLLAGTVEDDTLLTVAADAATEAARRLTLYKTRRDIFDVPVSLDLITANSLMLGNVVALQLARFGLDAGKSFRIIGIRLALASGVAILTLWG